MFRYLLACLLPVSLLAAETKVLECKDSAACYELGDRSFSQGDLVDAQKFFEKAVEKGDVQKGGFALGASLAETFEGYAEYSVGPSIALMSLPTSS